MQVTFDFCYYCLLFKPFMYNYQVEDEGTRQGNQETEPPLLSKQNLCQKFITCPSDFKDGYLMELLRSMRDDNSPPDIRSMIIFASTCR